MDSQAIAEWADKKATPANTPKYRRLTISDVGVLLKLAKDGLTQVEIAQRLGCSQGAVSEWVSKCQDTTDPAKQYLRGQALRMAKNIVVNGAAKDHVAALKGLSVLDEPQQSGLTIQIGGNGQDIKIAVLSPLQLQGSGESE
jgi:hypothetical protein